MLSKIAELLGFTVPNILALRRFHNTQKAVMITALKHFRLMAEKEMLSVHLISESTEQEEGITTSHHLAIRVHDIQFEF